jgi:hypothetical protein
MLQNPPNRSFASSSLFMKVTSRSIITNLREHLADCFVHNEIAWYEQKDRPLHFFVEPVVTYIGFDVHTAVVMKNTVFWDITPCSPMKVRTASRATLEAM